MMSGSVTDSGGERYNDRRLGANVTNDIMQCGSEVECRTRNQESPGSNTLCYHFKV